MSKQSRKRLAAQVAVLATDACRERVAEELIQAGCVIISGKVGRRFVADTSGLRVNPELLFGQLNKTWGCVFEPVNEAKTLWQWRLTATQTRAPRFKVLASQLAPGLKRPSKSFVASIERSRQPRIVKRIISGGLPGLGKK